MTSVLSLTAISHRYPSSSVMAVDDVSLDLNEGELLTLVGHSGSGKSTILNLISGFEKPTEGTITLAGEALNGTNHFVRPELRKIGLVSQSGALFPHLNVMKNLSYGLRSWPRAERKKRCQELLELVQLPHLAKRYPHEISGGESQRIALARALAPRPKFLLLDEPFSNLDQHLRESLRRVTSEVLRQEGASAIFITHHPEDALAFGDRVAVLSQGKLLQLDAPSEIWENPVSEKVATIFSCVNALACSETEEQMFLRPEQLTTLVRDSPVLAEGVVHSLEYLGSCHRAFIQPDDAGLPLLQVDLRAGEEVEVGKRVSLRRL